MYEEGTDVALPDAFYYWDTADLDGYGMRVTKTEIVGTEAFLARHHMTLEKLKEISSDGGDSFENDGLLYLVTAEFWNEKWMEPSNWPVLLDNFVLTGVDYFVLPATKSIHQIPDFNPELNGASGFSINSDRVFEVVLPYLIDTESEAGISLEDLMDSGTKLLLTVYPEERYLALPAPAACGIAQIG